VILARTVRGIYNKELLEQHSSVTMADIVIFFNPGFINDSWNESVASI
jgi:hypothetical protein